MTVTSILQHFICPSQPYGLESVKVSCNIWRTFCYRSLTRLGKDGDSNPLSRGSRNVDSAVLCLQIVTAADAHEYKHA